MKIHTIIYSIIALLFSILNLFFILGTFFFVILPSPMENRGTFYFAAILFFLSMLLLFVGSLNNIAKGRPVIWSTSLMIAGYILPIWFIPLAIWGGVLLYLGQKRQKSLVAPVLPSSHDLPVPP